MDKVLETAPDELVRAYKSNGIGVKRELLEQLLTHHEMKDAWKELANHVSKSNAQNKDEIWLRLWGAISHAKYQSDEAEKIYRRPSDRRDQYEQLAGKIRKLSGEVRDMSLDLLAYEFFDEEYLAVNGMQDLSNISIELRCGAAHKVLPNWPSITHLLEGLAKRAEKLGGDAMTTPSPAKRNRGNMKVRAFIWHLGSDFSLLFGEKLMGTIVRISHVVFPDTPSIDKSYVQSVLQGINNGG